MKNLVFWVLFFIIAGFGLPANSQQVNARTDTNGVLIGDHVKLILEYKSANKVVKLIWPAIVDSIGPLEVLARTGTDTVKQWNFTTLKQTYTLTAFDSGAYTIPSFTFGFEEKDTSGVLATNAFILNFNTVKVDTTLEIKDIKGPLSEGLPILSYLLYFLIAAVLIGLGIWGYLYWKKRRQKPNEDLDYDPNIPPHVLALEALKKLDSEKLWQSGYVKKYYIGLTDIIRIYLKRQFRIYAMEMITSEIITTLIFNRFDQIQVNNLRYVFETADLAKFAKHQPLPDENSRCMVLSVDFINKTIPAEQPEDAASVKNDMPENDLDTNENNTGEAK